MIALHPAIVHFPIALLSIAAMFATVSLFTKKEFFKEAAFWSLLFGVIGAVVAVITGLIEEQHLVHNIAIHQILVKHKFMGFVVLLFSFALLIWYSVRKTSFSKQEYVFWALFLVIGTAVTLYQGFLGGRMVFEQGAGVKPMELYIEKGPNYVNTHNHSKSTHDHHSDQDTTSSRENISGERHGRSTLGHDPISKQDTTRKDSIMIKEKKKELKDMKY